MELGSYRRIPEVHPSVAVAQLSLKHISDVPFSELGGQSKSLFKLLLDEPDRDLLSLECSQLALNKFYLLLGQRRSRFRLD